MSPRLRKHKEREREQKLKVAQENTELVEQVVQIMKQELYNNAPGISLSTEPIISNILNGASMSFRTKKLQTLQEDKVKQIRKDLLDEANVSRPQQWSTVGEMVLN